MELNEKFIGNLLVPMKCTWMYVRRERGTAFSKSESILKCMEVDRLKKLGFGSTANMLGHAINIHGQDAVHAYLIKHIPLV